MQSGAVAGKWANGMGKWNGQVDGKKDGEFQLPQAKIEEIKEIKEIKGNLGRR